MPRVPRWSGDVEQAARHVLAGFTELEVHPDVPDGVRTLHEAGFRLVTMTNGRAALTERLLSRAGLLHCFEGEPTGQRLRPRRARARPAQLHRS
ncbi:HAD family hydrolase [Streptomyces sp. ISL-99]|uniref:HAD family hydrolase n=1 Tax=Streptomyces sp. ISL-99 TaxID=2819193 RepID=UPI0035B0F133